MIKEKQQQEKELAINAWDMADERVKFFRNLLNLFPDSATRILPLLKNEHGAKILAPYNPGARTRAVACLDMEHLLKTAKDNPNSLMQRLAIFNKSEVDFK